MAGWRIALPGGTLDSGQVLMATNGYTGRLMPTLRRSIVPVHGAIIASAPRPERARASFLAERDVVCELGRITTHYRLQSAGRLLIVDARGRVRSRGRLSDRWDKAKSRQGKTFMCATQSRFP